MYMSCVPHGITVSICSCQITHKTGDHTTNINTSIWSNFDNISLQCKVKTLGEMWVFMDVYMIRYWNPDLLKLVRGPCICCSVIQMVDNNFYLDNLFLWSKLSVSFADLNTKYGRVYRQHTVKAEHIIASEMYNYAGMSKIITKIFV